MPQSGHVFVRMLDDQCDQCEGRKHLNDQEQPRSELELLTRGLVSSPAEDPDASLFSPPRLCTRTLSPHALHDPLTPYSESSETLSCPSSSSLPSIEVVEGAVRPVKTTAHVRPSALHTYAAEWASASIFVAPLSRNPNNVSRAGCDGCTYGGVRETKRARMGCWRTAWILGQTSRRSASSSWRRELDTLCSDALMNFVRL